MSEYVKLTGLELCGNRRDLDFSSLMWNCIVFVFIALLFYVVILVNLKRLGKKIKSDIDLSQASSKIRVPSEETDLKSSFDFDLIFLVAHLVTYATFIIIYLWEKYI